MCAAFLENIGWRWAFYVQACLLVPSFIGIMLIPSSYMDVQGTGELVEAMKKKQVVRAFPEIEDNAIERELLKMHRPETINEEEDDDEPEGGLEEISEHDDLSESSGHEEATSKLTFC